jgi:hypothetical protein
MNTINCINCESVTDQPSDDGLCGGCFDLEQTIELHLTRALEALRVVQFEHDNHKRDIARIDYSRKFDELLTVTDWSIEKAIRVLWNLLEETNA